MSILAVRIAPHIYDALSSYDIPGVREPAHNAHVTMLYFDSKELPSLDLIETLHDYCMGLLPFTATASKISSFSRGDEGTIPVIAPVVSPQLMKSRANIGTLLESREIYFNKKFPDYKPHITLSYSETGLNDFPVTPVTWTIESFELWCGEHNDNDLFVIFPFRGHNVRTAMTYESMAVRYSRFANMFESGKKGGLTF